MAFLLRHVHLLAGGTGDIGNIHSNTYNNAIWSLIQEMRVSLLFPLLFWVVSRNKVVTNLVIAMVVYRISMESPIPFLRDYGQACGAVVFIVSALGSGRISTILSKPLFTFLGNVSYAVYLNHLSVIYLLLPACYPVLPLWPLCIAVVATTLLISFPFWRYIERPSISLGRYLVQRTGTAVGKGRR